MSCSTSPRLSSCENGSTASPPKCRITTDGSHGITAEGSHDITAEGLHDITAEGSHDISTEGSHHITLRSVKICSSLVDRSMCSEYLPMYSLYLREYYCEYHVLLRVLP